MNDNIFNVQFGPRTGPDFKFFLNNPDRRYRMRDATEDDLLIPGVPEQRLQQGNRLVMERVSDPSGDLGFAIHYTVYCGRDHVADTDNDIGNLLAQAVERHAGNRDREFFDTNPSRRFRVRPTTIADLEMFDGPGLQPDPDQITIVERIGTASVYQMEYIFPLVQGEVQDTDEDISLLLQQLRRPVAPQLPEITPFTPAYVGDKAMVALTRHEMVLLADAIDADALNHDRQPGSCPRDLFDANARTAELRALAERF